MSHCDQCPLKGHKPLATAGDANSEIIFITPRPNGPQVAHQERMPREAGKLFQREMKDAGVPFSKALYHPAIRCSYDPDKYPSKERRAIAKCCANYALDLIWEKKPKVVVAMGADAASAVQGTAVAITKVKGVPVPMEMGDHHFTLYPMLSAVNAVIRPEELPSFRSDCQGLARLLENGGDASTAVQQSFGEYVRVDDLAFLVKQNVPLLAYDLETLGLRSYAPGAGIMTLQFTVAPGKAYVVVWDHPEDPMPAKRKQVVKEQIRQLLQNPRTRVIAQNGKFELVWTMRHLGFRFRLAEDTQMMACLLDENSELNLDDLTKRYVPEMGGYNDYYNATMNKERMDLEPLEKIIPYGGGDTDATFRLFQTLDPLLQKDKKLYAHYRYASIPGLNMLSIVDFNGLDVDDVALTKFQEEMTTLVETSQDELLRMVPRDIRRKWMAKLAEGNPFGKQDFVRDWLFYHPKGYRLTPVVFTKNTAKLADESQRVPSTSSKDHLPIFLDSHPELSKLIEFTKNSRMLNASVIKFRENYITANRVYPIYALHKTVTGRSSSEDPNGQNFPKRGDYAKIYRRVFKVPKGWGILEADYSQAELRIAADMANEKTMLRVYNSGGDLHTESALLPMKLSMAQFRELPKEVQKAARQKAKAINFGFIYGMWWRKFIIYAKTQYGVDFTPQQAEEIYDLYFAKYSGLKPWHERMKEAAMRNGYVRSYSGRIRHLPTVDSPEDYIVQEALRQAINSPVQEFASTNGIIAMARMEHEIDNRIMRPLAFVHDAIYVATRVEYIDWAARKLKHYMETNPIEEWFGVRMKVPMVAEVSYSPENLGDVTELKGFEIEGEYDYSTVGLELPPQKIPQNDGRAEQHAHLEWFLP